MKPCNRWMSGATNTACWCTFDGGVTELTDDACDGVGRAVDDESDDIIDDDERYVDDVSDVGDYR